MSPRTIPGAAAMTAALLLLGCGPGESPQRLMDTGWFTTSETFAPDTCTTKITGFDPDSGADDWYWQDSPRFWVDNASSDAYTYTLVDTEGVPAPATPSWDENGLILTFELDAPLEPDTDYVLAASDCATQHTVPFRTSSYGQPLTISPDEMIGRTFDLDMLGADWVAPAGAEALIQLYFSSPALLGVRYADDVRIDLLGAPGDEDVFGNLFQGSGATWDFPIGAFDGSPFFSVDAEQVVFQYDGIEIPIHGAHLEGTWAPDGRSMGGGRLSGLGDTRDLGSFIDQGNEEASAVCDLAAGFGVQCEPCPDGFPYCLFLEALDIEGDLIEGLVLVPRTN